MSCNFQSQDLSSQIRQAAAQWQGTSGQGQMHIAFTKETVNGREETRIVVVPVQNGPAIEQPPGSGNWVYGPAFWGPCPQDLRAQEYHDPFVPGSKDPVTGCVWKQEVGFVEPTDAGVAESSYALEALCQAAINYAASVAK